MQLFRARSYGCHQKSKVGNERIPTPLNYSPFPAPVKHREYPPPPPSLTSPRTSAGIGTGNTVTSEQPSLLDAHTRLVVGPRIRAVVGSAHLAIALEPRITKRSTIPEMHRYAHGAGAVCCFRFFSNTTHWLTAQRTLFPLTHPWLPGHARHSARNGGYTQKR